MHVQSLTMKPELEAHFAKSEIVHNINGQGFDPEMIQCHICREYA